MVRLIAIAAVAVLVLTVLPVAATVKDPVIRAGIDPWMTVPEGTKVDFEHDPLPAGFFCTASPAFTGRIWLRGVPLASDNPQYANIDTVVERLDDAVFDSRGVAQTRFQMRALQLEGVRTFKNQCGEYHVQVKLDGEQPITRMQILRDGPSGGRFLLTVKINAKVVFTRGDNPAERLDVAYPVTFKPSPYHRWSLPEPSDSAQISGAMIDTDWDGTPDTLVRGTSNFTAGQDSSGLRLIDHGCHMVVHPNPHGKGEKGRRAIEH
jgi:hypothetical protein